MRHLRPEIAELDGLFDPRSVAVVGASADPGKWGHWLARGALAGRHRRTVHLVNRGRGEVLGVRCAGGLAELPEAAELVAVATPPAHVPAVIGEALRAGSRYFVVITTGVGDPPTQEAETELADRVRAAGARLLGPNCMGLVDSGNSLSLSWGDFPVGSVALVSQSGNVGLEVGRMLARAGLGFSRFVSLGNQRGVDAADAIESLVHHPPTRLVAAYVEGFRDGRRLARVLASAREAGKPVLLLTVGRSDAASRVAASHTGALVSATDVVAAMCRESRALLMRSTGELVDTAQALLARVPPRTGRVVVVGDSGGQCALAADTLADEGLTVPTLEAATVAGLTQALPPQAHPSNPVDLAGAGEQNLGSYPGVARLLGSDPDGVTLLTGYFGDYATGTPGLLGDETAAAAGLAQVAVESGRPVVVHSMGRDTEPLRQLRQFGVPVYERIEQAVAAIARAAHWHSLTQRIPGSAAEPPAAVPLTSGDYEDVRALLAGRGVPFPEAEFVVSEAEAVDAARRLGYPLVLKAMGLAHKTEAGGVALGVEDEARLRTELERMRARTGAERYAVERLVRCADSHELIVGVGRDPAFGPVVLVGQGGTATELERDTAVALAPLDRTAALELIRSLRHAPLLEGWRGAPPADLDAAAELVVAVAQTFVAHPEVAELEVNPVLVHPGGVVALDAAALLAAPDRVEDRTHAVDGG
jgi:acyl-CoA synthetase (NDP forming)